MKKLGITFLLASLSFGAFAQDTASLICKTKIKRKELHAKEGQVGKIRIQGIKGSEAMEVLVSKIHKVHSQKEIEYFQGETGSVSPESYSKLINKIGFKGVSSKDALKTSSYFVYINKKGLKNIEAEVINRDTGERSVLKSCHQTDSFLSRLVKQ